jgi:acid phosphatase class B
MTKQETRVITCAKFQRKFRKKFRICSFKKIYLVFSKKKKQKVNKVRWLQDAYFNGFTDDDNVMVRLQSACALNTFRSRT